MKSLDGDQNYLHLRFLHGGAVNRDHVLEQLRVCSAEDEVFDVVGKNKTKLTVSHVSQAVEMLWQFQKEKPQILRTVELVRSHPQFLTLRVLAENKIGVMEDFMLVDILYSILRLNIDPHDSLVQQLISEAWLRLDRFPMSSLSKFAICLSDQGLQHSPLMGNIANIVAQRLSSIDDIRILTTLMISISSLLSPRLRDALIDRADDLLDTMDASNYNSPRRVVQFLRNIKHSNRPLLEKCNKVLLCNIPSLDAENISIIMGLYQSLQFNDCDFRLAVKQRLTELLDTSTDAFSFTKLFVALAPMATEEIRERLENTALLVADELSPHQALAVCEALEEIKSRNLKLLNRVASVIQRNLDVYRPVEVARITQTLFFLHYQNPELFNKLRNTLVNFLQRSFLPYEIIMLARVLSMLPSPRLYDIMISRANAVVGQCSLNDLNTLSFAIAKWVRSDPSYRHNTPSKYVRLVQNLNRCGQERLRKADRLDLVLEELKYMSGEWFEEMLVEETMATLQRMIDQINWTNMTELALFLTKINHLCPPLMERIASVAIKDIDKLHYTATYATLLPFSTLNYDTPQADELYDVCVRHVTPRLSSFDPHLLVLMAYSLAVADCFPEVIIKEIFSIDFLGRLDSQLETLPDALNLRTRQRLMELNRAVCLQCPEFSPAQQQIHKMLSEVLGGINRVQVAVVTPYFYTVEFECVLDKHLQSLPYSDTNTLQMSDRGKVLWTMSPEENIRDEIPPGAQRVAVDFLDSKTFCKNTHHIKGEALMRKRHLEILGYRVVQIPHFEWNSMELSTQDGWKEYLKRKIFKELSP
ncbi:FAST kinase domain-containing protein 1, mitochondrial [Collichthys lucidus]|uniref:FAST kinase domain-containing protein 1, mitochondrial n=1 Tax=Collichthys lucidus TaxID=240159 RepID=A0A4U5TZT6_COLLU|nr:FAST kinase domain-containing protein 1, mitochondrial [Collichthys lucidus]